MEPFFSKPSASLTPDDAAHTTTPTYNALPWNEKYRPTRLTDVHGQASIVALFQRMMQHNKPMHLLFYGPPGTGKTSSIMSFCKNCCS